MAEQLSNPVSTQVEQQTQDNQDEASHTLTDEEVDQLEQYKVKEGSLVWLMLGVTGTGKSCVGNFILGQGILFPESSRMISETATAALRSSSFDSENLCVIDTPGLGDTKNVGSLKSGAEDVAYDYSALATELTKVMMMTDQGINAFLIVVPANHRDFRGLHALLDFVDIIGDYWNHSILVVTHGKKLGKTEEEQYTEYHEVLADLGCPAPLKKLRDKVNGRLVIVESKKWRNRLEYHCSVVGKIMKYSKEITDQHGPFKDDVQSIGKAANEKAKLDPELRKEFVNFDSPEAQKAIYQSTFKHVKGVIHKLVRIKLADGEDVVKLKKMAELKEGELKEVRQLTHLFREEFQEEKKKRRQAEESLKQAEIRQIKAEGERDSAVIQKQEAEKKRVAAEQQKERADDNWRAAELQRERAEGDRRVAEQQRDSAEENRTTALQEKETAERKIISIRQDLQTAEAEKTLSDQQRRNAENEMEEVRKKAEKAERSRTAAVEQKEKADREIREAENRAERAERIRAASINEKERADRNLVEADRQRAEADKQRVIAEKKWATAVALKEKAEREKTAAENEVKKANSARTEAEQTNEILIGWAEKEEKKGLFRRLLHPAKLPDSVKK